MLWVIRNSYGYNRKKSRPASVREIAKDVDMTPSSVGLALQILIGSGVIIKSNNGEMGLNKENISCVRETGRLKVSEKLDKSVRETGQSVRETGQPIYIRSKDNLKDSKHREFVCFWMAYPKKEGRDLALNAWLTKSPPLDKCLATLKWQCPVWAKGEERYIPLPHNWINAGKWQDVPNTHNLVACSKCGVEGILPKSVHGSPICRKCKGLGE